MRRSEAKSIKFFAFTLAEVLIVLGIIGIVAEMTIPTLMSKTRDAEMKAAWKTNYANIYQAYQMAKTDNGGDVSDFFSGAPDSQTVDPFFPMMESHLNVVQTCSGASDYLLCDSASNVNLASAYKTAAGTVMPKYDFFYHQTKLNNGANLYYRFYTQADPLIFVDVNGYGKKPNVLGRVLFGAIITKDKIIPMGAVNSGTEGTCVSTVVAADASLPNGTYHVPTDISGAGCSSDYLYK